MQIDFPAPNSSIDLGALGPRRTFTVLGGDGSTAVTFYVANAPGAPASAGAPMLDTRFLNQGNTFRILGQQQATLDTTANFVGYTLTGTAPSAVSVQGGAAAVQGVQGPAWISGNAWALVTGTAYVASPGELVKVNTAAATTVTLPSAVGIAGQRVRIQDATGTAATHNITVATTGGQTVDGSAPAAIATNNGGTTYVSDGANWTIGS